MCRESCGRLTIFLPRRRSISSGKCWTLAGRWDMRFTTSIGHAMSSCWLSCGRFRIRFGCGYREWSDRLREHERHNHRGHWGTQGWTGNNESKSAGGGRGVGLSWGWSCGVVRDGDSLDVRARSGYRRGGDSIDVDGGGDGSATHCFAGGQKANRPVSSRTFGLVERIVGQDKYLLVVHELRLGSQPRKNRPADRTGGAQILLGAFYHIRPASDRIENAVSQSL